MDDHESESAGNAVLENIRIPVIADIVTKKMTLEQIRSIRKGVVLEFANMSVDEFPVAANNVNFGAGEAIIVNQKFGIRLKTVSPERKPPHA